MTEGQEPSIGIVIPSYGDLGKAIALGSDLKGHPACSDVVIADATPGSDQAPGQLPDGVSVIRCERPGRGGQLNAGAAEAGGGILLFNHADTEIGWEHLDALVRASKSGVRAGAFHRAFGVHHPKLAFLEPVVRWWAPRFGTLYGDQSVFVTREVFEGMGGFREIPLMEDVDLSWRLRKSTSVTLLDPPLVTSMRRFQSRGYLKTKLQNTAFLWLFRFGVSPNTLYRWYYGRDPG